MKDSIYIKSQIDSTITNITDGTMDSKPIYESKLALLSWIYNANQPKTEDEVKIKLQNTEERLAALDFMGDTTSIERKIVLSEISILKDILS